VAPTPPSLRRLFRTLLSMPFDLPDL